MLTIRFSRTGKKKQAQYRVIISENHKDPWGDNLEILGNYNPHTKEANLKEDKIKHWLSVGAQTSNSVHNLLVKQGIIEAGKKKAVSISKKRTTKKAEATAEDKKEEAPVETKPEATDETKPVEDKKEESKPEEKPQPKADAEKSEDKAEKTKEEPKVE